MKNKLLLVVAIGFITMLSVPAFSQTSLPANQTSSPKAPINNKLILPASGEKPSIAKQVTPTQPANASMTSTMKAPVNKKLIQPGSEGKGSAVKSAHVAGASTVNTPHKKFIEPSLNEKQTPTKD